MVTIGMNYAVLPGKEQVFEDACKNVVQVLSEAPGHDESKVYRCIDSDGAEYLIVSRWHDEQAFNDFIASDKFRKVTNWGAENILAGRPRHTTYRHE